MLFVGGRFTCVDESIDFGVNSTPGLARWTQLLGLIPFPGGGLTHDDVGADGVAFQIRFDHVNQVYI